MRRPWVVVGTVALLTALVLGQQFAVVPGGGRVAAGLQNAFHGPWFAAVTALLYRLFRTRRAIPSALVATFIAALLLALGTEAAQGFGRRQPEWLDVGFDLLGAAAALSVLSGRWLGWRTLPTWTIASALMLVSLSPVLLAAGIQAHRNAIFPRLVDVAAPWHGGLLEREAMTRVIPAPAEWQGAPAQVLEVTLTDTEWPGIHLPEPVPDWRAFEALVVDVFVVGDDAPLPLSVSIRLRGAATDHVYRTQQLGAGAHRLHLPLRTLFDPERATVTRVVVYSTRAHAGRAFLLGDVRLVGSAQSDSSPPPQARNRTFGARSTDA